MKQTSKPSKLLIGTVILSLVLLASCLWTAARNHALEENLERCQSDLYLMVMHDLNKFDRLYHDLSQLTAEVAHTPDAPELRVRIAGILDGIDMSHGSAWPVQYNTFVQLYGGDRALADAVQQQMERVQRSLCLSDDALDALSAMSAEELEAVSDLYEQLGKCFYRADGSFGELFMARKFDDEEFSPAMQKIDDLLSQLQAYY